MSQEYKSEAPSYCIICCKQVSKGDQVEVVKPKSGRTIYAHAECYAKEKDKRGRKA